jgi:hypothetical protein
MMKKKYICPSISICEMSVDSIILAASIGFNNEVSDAVQLAKPFTATHLILKKMRKMPTPCSMFGD